MKLFDIGFLPIHLVDVFDVLIVTGFLYVLYNLVKGSIGLNIFIGFLLIFFASYVVHVLNMRLLDTLFTSFLGLGPLVLLIVFQQELRRFLLFVGRDRLSLNGSGGWRGLMPWNWRTTNPNDINFEDLAKACKTMSGTKTGALIVLARSSELRFYSTTGIPIEGEVTTKLIESIFMKNGPLHDGAMIIARNRVKAAGCILPVSESTKLPPEFGLRHRSALGISEQTDAMAIIVSEETGRITLANRGEISADLKGAEKLDKLLFREYYELSGLDD